MSTPTLTQRMLNEPPTDRWCKSGHKAQIGVRFFAVSGQSLPQERWGNYCEDCLIAANKLLQARKAQQAAETNSAAFIDKLIAQLGA